jgi:hypothetical protein
LDNLVPVLCFASVSVVQVRFSLLGPLSDLFSEGRGVFEHVFIKRFPR